MVKKLIINKKVMAILMLFITIFSTISPVFAISGSGNANWVGGQFDSNIRTTDSSPNCRNTY